MRPGSYSSTIIHPEIRPSINVTSIFAKASEDEPNGNTIYQEAAVGASPPWDWDFYLFGADGGPQPLHGVRRIIGLNGHGARDSQDGHGDD